MNPFNPYDYVSLDGDSSRGTTITSLHLNATGAFCPITEMPNFEPIRQMHDQPIVSLLPLGVGPFFACSSFDKDWFSGTIRPLETTMRIEQAYVPGLDTGSFLRSARHRASTSRPSAPTRCRCPGASPYPPYATPLLDRRSWY